VSFTDPAPEEEEAVSEARAGACSLVAGGGHCDDFSSVVLHDSYIGFNDWSENGGVSTANAELVLPEADRERVWSLLVEAGRKLLEIQAIGEEWRERLVEEARRAPADRDAHRYRAAGIMREP